MEFVFISAFLIVIYELLCLYLTVIGIVSNNNLTRYLFTGIGVFSMILAPIIVLSILKSSCYIIDWLQLEEALKQCVTYHGY